MVEAQDAHGSVSSVTGPLTGWVWGQGACVALDKLPKLILSQFPLI